MNWTKGSTIMEAKPYAHVIMQKFAEARCNSCLARSESLRKCGACKKRWYCCISCQKEDWKIHKLECAVIKNTPRLPPDSICLFLRLVIKYKMGATTQRLESQESPCIRTFNDLESHTKEIKEDQSRMEQFQMACDFVLAYAQGVLEIPTEDTLLDIFGKMVINTFTIGDETLEDVGVGIYNSPSVVDHRCCPNAVASFVGKRLYIRAVEDIDGDKDYTQIYLCYIDPMVFLADRQSQLQQQYYFACKCRTCSDETLETMMNSTEGSSDDDVLSIKACLATVESIKKREGDPKEIASICQKCLKDVCLPNTNLHVVSAVDNAFEAAIDAEMWEEALMLGRQNLEAYERLHPPYSPSVGNLFAKVGKLLVFLDRCKEAQTVLKKALTTFLVSLGERHYLSLQVRELLEQCRQEIASQN